jgi:hypothetical protein
MRILLSALAATFLFAGTAQAQMVRAQDPTTVANVLRDMGYKAEVTKDDSGDPLIKSSSGGSNFAVFFFGCTKNTDCRTVQFFAGYTDRKPTLAKINEWNMNKRFGRAYISSSGSARVEMDVDLDDGGVSTKLFEDNIEFWVLLMGQFEKHIAG